MTQASAQRALLHRSIWSIADDVRGVIDGWDFKQYVLGALFYRFISEDFARFVENGDPDVDYKRIAKEEIDDEFYRNTLSEKGYFIYPEQLFANVVERARQDENLNITIEEIFSKIEQTGQGVTSGNPILGLFSDFDTRSPKLGNTVKERNKRLADIFQGVANLDFGALSDSDIDVFGDAYEYLISNYAANAGKSGGEFFTPQSVSKLLARLGMLGMERIDSVYDPACGSGSLLLQVKKHSGGKINRFVGQEINHTTYNLARMNMFLHEVNFERFNIYLGDTLTAPHLERMPFDLVVSNPPYSIKWIGSDDPTLINDERFAPAGVLAPKSKGDFAFILHALHVLSAKGRAVIVCFPGIFYRTGAEKTIRQYLVDAGVIEAVIDLPDNLFFGTSIKVTLLVLSKRQKDRKIAFINASDCYKKETNNNALTDAHIDTILGYFEARQDAPHLVTLADIEAIRAQDYNLSVSTYVEAKDTRQAVDITALNADIAQTVRRIDALRAKIDAIVRKIEGGTL